MQNKTHSLNKHAWENYWTDGRANGAIGCLPDSTPEIVDLQLDFWKSALIGLPRKARIVDLATGDGSVLRQIHRVRKDLKLVGVDYSSTLPKVPKPIKLRANVDMENLPFSAASISGYVSRFGIEYGDVERIAQEIERTLVPDGAFAFLIHHSDSPIHVINKARADQLSWALGDQGVIKKAEAYLRARGQLGSLVPAGFRSIAGLAAEKFGQYSVAAEFSQAVLRTLSMGVDQPAQVCLSIIGQLNNHSQQEIRRIRAMVDASRDDAEMEAFEEQFAALSLHTQRRIPLILKSEGQPIGWAINGQKTG